MLDPLTSLSLAVNVVQLVDFGFTTCSKIRELVDTGTTADFDHLETLLQANLRLCSETESDADSAAEKQLHELALSTQDASQELSSMLSSLSLADSNTGTNEERPNKRRRTAACRYFKGLWKEKDVKKVEGRMKDLQQQLILNLSMHHKASSSTVLRSLKDIEKILQDERAERITSYEKLTALIVKQTQAHAKTVEERTTAKNVISSLDGMAEQAKLISTCQRVLKTLSFDVMHSRKHDISEAHEDTFKWIFENNNLSFEKWAAEKDGIFWITGKPGSGKSTLMKFLMRHPRTKELLRKWAGDDDLIIADHYFWNAGSSLQRSRLGLLRTILVHIIFQCPEVAIQAMPERFRRSTLSHYGLRWTQAELFETIKAVSLQKNQGVRLCFFIDGLDENTEEHIDLIELLSILADSPSIKLCVSSRPWNVFTRAYHERTDGQIAVQDLTQRDIKAYVHDKMSNNLYAHPLHSRHPKQWRDLIENISQRAEGVFLWVRLVVRSLLRGLGNDDDLETLERRLDSYPTDLDGYFQRMFDRIEDVYLLTSARIMLTAISAEAGLPVWAPRCIERETTVPDYAVTVPPRDPDIKNNADLISIKGTTCAGWLVFGPKCPHICDGTTVHNCPNPWETDPDEIDEVQRSMQMESLSRYIDARCADLLEVQSEKIAFIHRTARDFLRQRELPNILLKQAGTNFDVGLSLGRIYLAGAKRSEYSGIERMRDVVELVKPSNMESYAALFDNFAKDLGFIHLVLPPEVQHLRMLAEAKEVGYQPFVADESQDFEILFGCHK